MAQAADDRVAVIATDGFEEAELTEPVKALRDAGVKVDIIAPHGGSIQAFRHHDKSITVKVDRTLGAANPEDYLAVVLPGGALNADALRMNTEMHDFIHAMDDAHKPMAIICHAPWELVSAGLARGRTMTSWPTLQDDIRNAGGQWVDREVVVDGNLITSRKPDDLPVFNRELLQRLTKQHASAAAGDWPAGDAAGGRVAASERLENQRREGAGRQKPPTA
ncbi:MAG TPA: type 1 glutamine amidotransferase domain-containing protein [Ktedonobacterales bacterium]